MDDVFLRSSLLQFCISIGRGRAQGKVHKERSTALSKIGVKVAGISREDMSVKLNDWITRPFRYCFADRHHHANRIEFTEGDLFGYVLAGEGGAKAKCV